MKPMCAGARKGKKLALTLQGWQTVAAFDSKLNQFNPEGKTAMKTSALSAAILVCILSTAGVSAQEKPAMTRHAMGMNMDKHMPQLQENMKIMQKQMEKVSATSDPKDRQKLMHEHMHAMQENMKAMRGMGGPMMMGDSHAGDMTKAGKKGGMNNGDMMKHHAMMEKRMDMMQMMMEQMIAHDQMMGSMPAK